MLFKNITIIDENFNILENMYVEISGKNISYIGKKEPKGNFQRIYHGEGKLLMSGFVNSHAHSPMMLLRGYAENMKLQDWLHKKVFPFEEYLTSESVYFATLLAMAESLKFGIVSTSDMYYFMDDIARAVSDSGAKINMARSISHFDTSDFMSSYRAKEMKEAYEKYHNIEDGRIRVDMSLHGEYTSNPETVKQLAEYTKSTGAHMQVHVSETEEEVKECIKKYGMTPVEYLSYYGLFDTPTTAAHCVWLRDQDYHILKEKGVTVAVNAISNLKLASGVCDVQKLIDKGINVTIGTDSVASNNNLNMIEEMKMFALISKMMFKNPELVTPIEALKAATINGAQAQGRTDSGILKEGYRADLIVLDTSVANMQPIHSVINNLVYSASGSDVVMTMVDGEILYENGEYTRIDLERTLFEVQRLTKGILKKI